MLARQTLNIEPGSRSIGLDTMSRLRFVPVLVIAALFAVSVASFAVAPAPGTQSTHDLTLPQESKDCAPPCGYIWPRIGVETDIQSPFKLSNIGDFPTEADVEITYSWDMEQEGTGITDPTEEMEILVIVSRTPVFMDAQLSQSTCTFVLLPAQPENDVCTIKMSIQIDEELLPDSEKELKDTGHRLMLFAASEESGTFRKAYGLEDVRFQFDGEEPEVLESPAPVAPLLGIALLTALLVARLRRREDR